MIIDDVIYVNTLYERQANDCESPQIEHDGQMMTNSFGNHARIMDVMGRHNNSLLLTVSGFSCRCKYQQPCCGA